MALHNMTLQLSDDAYRLVEQLASQLGSSKKEVIKKAISLLDIAIREQKSGSTIEFINQQKETRKAMLPII